MLLRRKIPQPQKPKQNLWDRVVDVFSANTPMDQYRRHSAGEAADYRQQQLDRGVASRSIANNPAQRAVNTIRAAGDTLVEGPRHLRNFATESLMLNDKNRVNAQLAQERLADSQAKLRRHVANRLKDPNIDKASADRLIKLYNSSLEDSDKNLSDMSARSKEMQRNLDTRRTLAAGASTVLDMATLGVGAGATTAMRGAAKAGGRAAFWKQAAKEGSKIAPIGAASGGLYPFYTQDKVQAGDVVKGAAMGAATGFAVPTVMYGGGKLIRAARNFDSNLNQSGHIGNLPKGHEKLVNKITKEEAIVQSAKKATVKAAGKQPKARVSAKEAPKRVYTEPQKKLQKEIHSIIRKEGLTDARYRNMAKKTTGKTSTTEMNAAEMARLKKALVELKAKPKVSSKKPGRYDDLAEYAGTMRDTGSKLDNIARFTRTLANEKTYSGNVGGRAGGNLHPAVRLEQDILKNVNEGMNTVRAISEAIGDSLKRNGLKNSKKTGKLVGEYLEGINRKGAPKAVKAVAKDFEEIYRGLLKMRNAARKAEGRPLIKARKDFMNHIVEMDDWTKVAPKNNDRFIPSNKFTQARKGGNYKYEKNAFKAMSRYIDASYKDIYTTRNIRLVDEFRKGVADLGLEKASKWLDRYVDENLKSFEKSGLAKVAEKYIAARSSAALGLNIRFILGTMPASLAGDFRFPVSAAKGFVKYLVDPKTRALVAKKSQSLQIKQQKGSVSQLFGDIDGSINRLQRGVGSVSDVVSAPGNWLEQHLHGMSVATGYEKGRSIGLKGRQLDAFADHIGQITQSMYTKETRSLVLNNTYVRAIFPFQTFSLEMAGYIRNFAGAGGGIPMTVGQRVSQATGLITAIVAYNYVYEKATGNGLTSIGSAIPFVGGTVDTLIDEGYQRVQAARGSQGAKDELERRDNRDEGLSRYTKSRGRFPLAPGAEATQVIDAVKSYVETGDVQELRKQLIFWGSGITKVGGGVQINRIIDTFLAAEKGYHESKGKVRYEFGGAGDIATGLVGGPSMSPSGREAWKNEEWALSLKDSEEYRDIPKGDVDARREFRQGQVKKYKAGVERRDDRKKRDKAAELTDRQKTDIESYRKSSEFDDDGNLQYDPFRKYVKASLLFDDKVYNQAKGDAEYDFSVDGKPIDPIFTLSKAQRLKILHRRGLTPGGKDPELNFSLQDKDWYDDFQVKQDKYYRDMDVYAKRKGYKPLDNSNPYPTPSKKTQAVLDEYAALPTGDGPQGGNMSRRLWIENNPEKQKLREEHFALVNAWTNEERKKVGLDPLPEDEYLGMIERYDPNKSGSGGSGGRGSGGRRSEINAAKYMRVASKPGAPSLRVTTRAKKPTVRARAAAARPTVTSKKSMV